MTYEENKPWRKKILLDLQDRNRRQCDPFAELIRSREFSFNVSRSMQIPERRRKTAKDSERRRKTPKDDKRNQWL